MKPSLRPSVNEPGLAPQARPWEDRAGGPCWGLLLAAGQGRRFEGRKLLAALRGRPLVAYAAGAAVASVQHGWLAGALAVTATGDVELAAVLRAAGLEVVESEDAAAGLGASLRGGLAAVGARDLAPQPQAAVVFLGDQPLVKPRVVRDLVRAWRDGPAQVVRPRYAATPEIPGHPVLVDRTLWSLAGALDAATGLGPLFTARPDRVRILDVPGDNPDVDTPDQLLALERRLSTGGSGAPRDRPKAVT